MLAKILRSLVLSTIGCIVSHAEAKENTLELFIDADYSISVAAAQSIELGVRTALDEVGFEVAGTRIRVVPMDHRGNVKRARRTYERYLESEQALAVIGGLHSPPYLAHKDYINSNGVLTLLPWSAAGPITRSKAGHDNWIFRLSVDDTQSGSFLVNEAVEKAGCEKIALILLENGWGHANQKTLTAALAARDMAPVTTEFFSTAIGDATALSLAARIGRTGADCGVLLSNWDNGALVLNALHQHGTDIRIFSHWGIMGGEFTRRVDDQTRRALKLRVLQTCALRRESEGNSLLAKALTAAAPDLESISEIPAATGFVHGYDLTRILIEAARQAAESETWDTASIQEKRAKLRQALENLENPVPGILGPYDPPFYPFGPQSPDAHEALGIDDLCIAKFGSDGRLENAL